MVNEEVLQDYSNSIKILKKQCEDAGMSEDEFKKLYFESLHSLHNNERQVRNIRLNRKVQIILVGIAIVLYATYNYKSIYSSLQEFIYPGLKILRRITIPFISLFPSLTDLYHETCLVHNPFFTVVDMDCWPCSSVSTVREVSDPVPVTQQHAAPLVYETNQQVINLDTLRSIYSKHKHVFDKESPKIFVNNKYYISPGDLFYDKSVGVEENYYVWRLTHMNVARMLRQYIPRPKIVPKFGQSTERFIIIDTSGREFQVPDTECNFSFLLSLSGSRTVYLNPAEECKHQCKTLKIKLNESHLLWYNWWYWRPSVQPNGNSTLVAHVGSYC